MYSEGKFISLVAKLARSVRGTKSSPIGKSCAVENFFEKKTRKIEKTPGKNQIAHVSVYLNQGFLTGGKFHPCSGKIFLICCSEKLFYSNT